MNERLDKLMYYGVMTITKLGSLVLLLWGLREIVQKVINRNVF